MENKEQVEEYLSIISNSIIDSLPKRAVLKKLIERHNFDLGEYQFNKLYKKAIQEIKNNNLDKKFEIGKARRRLEKLYLRNFHMGDFKECRAIIESEAKLFGWTEPDKTEITTRNTFDFKKVFTFDSIEEEETQHFDKDKP